MLKKYLNYYGAVRIFTLFAFSLILCYVVSMTMFLAMPPSNLHNYTVISDGLIYLEYILASLLITIIFITLITYLTKIKK